MKRLPDGFRQRGDAIVRDFSYQGKRVRVTVGSISDIAAALANAPAVEKAEKARIDGERHLTFADLAERWLRGRLTARRMPGGVKLADQRVRDHINPVIGHLVAGCVEEDHLWGLRNRLTEKGLKPSTIRQLLSEVRGILRYGERQRTATGALVIEPGRNPWNGDLMPVVEQPPRRDLTDEQVDKIVSACSNPDQEFVVRMLVLTGIRWQELRNLEWKHFQPGPPARLVLEHTKSRRVRWIPLVAEAAEMLHERQRATAAIGGYISPYRALQGSMLSTRLASRAGFHFSFHRLRHTWARRMIEMGLSAVAVQGGLGHSTVKTTEAYLPPAFEILAMALQSVPETCLRSCSQSGRSSHLRSQNKKPAVQGS